MNFRRALFGPLVILSFFFLYNERASACACCSSEDQYLVHAGRPSAYDLGLLENMRFADTANLMIEPEVAEPWTLVGALAGRQWKLSFSDGKNSGALNLSMPARISSSKADIHDGRTSDGGGPLLPARISSSKADIHDGRTSDGGGPLLYKEWRMEGTASGAGFFKGGNYAPSKYLLLFQGRGNNCDNPEDFTHWRLEMTGRKTTYVFFGMMAGAR